MASGCDQCMWAVGVVAGHGHWVGHSMMRSVANVCLKLSNLISLPCFNTFCITINHQPYIAFQF